MSETRWYVAVLVVESRVDDGIAEKPLVDLQHRLIRAASPEAAYARALEVGRREEHSYRNSEGAMVTWVFSGLHDLDEVVAHELSDGVEVYSRLVRDDAGGLVVPMERLSVFWFESNKHKRARDILAEE